MQGIKIAVENFNLKYTLECGQCFRWKRIDEYEYIGVIQDRVLRVKQEENMLYVWSNNEDNLEEVVKHYFALDMDYKTLESLISKIDANVSRAVRFSSGIRILRQPLFETYISYIISANNNISRISKSVDLIAKKWGKGYNCYEVLSMLTVEKSTVDIGIEKPIRLLHISDAHIDIVKAQGKSENTEIFEKALEYARENGLIVICTGDNFNGVSPDNLEYAAEHMTGEGIFILGNHDFCSRPDNIGLSDPAYFEKYAKAWAPCYKSNIEFDSQIIGGVNFVTLSNAYYSISPKQVALLKKECEKGYPIVLCMHVPLFSTEQADKMMSTWAKCAYMMIPPESYYSRYIERHLKEQLPTKEACDAVEYIKNEPAIKAVIAGHIHESFDGYADCGKRMITTAPVKDGFVREIEIV